MPTLPSTLPASADARRHRSRHPCRCWTLLPISAQTSGQHWGAEPGLGPKQMLPGPPEAASRSGPRVFVPCGAPSSPVLTHSASPL